MKMNCNKIYLVKKIYFQTQYKNISSIENKTNSKKKF